MAGFALLVTLVKVGVPIAIGWWIDLSLDENQEKKIRRRLDAWWIRFDGITWFNFGQEEGKAALRLFDRVFGSRLWSWRRWISVVVVYVAGVALTIAWGLGELDSIGARPPMPTTFDLMKIAAMALVNIHVELISLALNLSLTRIASNSVVRLPGSFSIFGFGILFLVSVLLFILWGPLTDLAKVSIPIFFFIHWKLVTVPGSFPNPLEFLLSVFGSARRDFWFTIHQLSQMSLRIIDLARPHDVKDMWGAVAISVFALAGPIADAFVSTVRILFSAFFVACFALRRLVLRPLAKLGFIWLTSGNPIFATLFGAIAAVIVFGQELLEALS